MGKEYLYDIYFCSKPTDDHEGSNNGILPYLDLG